MYLISDNILFLSVLTTVISLFRLKLTLKNDWYNSTLLFLFLHKKENSRRDNYNCNNNNYYSSIGS